MSDARTDFTKGSILGKLIPFMIPILGALILQAAYGAVDLLVVGRFGTTEGLSAVSTGSQVLNLVTFVITQFAMGITVLIARYIGEKRQSDIGADRRIDRCLCHYISGVVCCYDQLCRSNFQTDAGTQRGAAIDHELCSHLRGRHFLCCRL